MTDYIVAANVVVDAGQGWTATKEVPSFVLPGGIHGLLSEEAAERLAEKMLTELVPGCIRVDVHAVRYEPATIE
jgi:hypothetical protein